MERATKNVRLGLTLPIGGAQDAAELARASQACGYEELWLAEVGGADADALAGALAVSVPGMRIGTAVVPAQTRTPMVHAMAGLTLSQLTGGTSSSALASRRPTSCVIGAASPTTNRSPACANTSRCCAKC